MKGVEEDSMPSWYLTAMEGNWFLLFHLLDDLDKTNRVLQHVDGGAVPCTLHSRQSTFLCFNPLPPFFFCRPRKCAHSTSLWTSTVEEIRHQQKLVNSSIFFNVVWTTVEQNYKGSSLFWLELLHTSMALLRERWFLFCRWMNIMAKIIVILWTKSS